MTARGALTAAIVAANGKLTAQEIADAYGTTYNSVQATIHRLRHYEGMAIKLPRPRMPRPSRDRVQALADGTRTYQDIADELGLTNNCVRSHVVLLRRERAPISIKHTGVGSCS
jgi:DNA-binding CsgD family transcriptional regulator